MVVRQHQRGLVRSALLISTIFLIVGLTISHYYNFNLPYHRWEQLHYCWSRLNTLNDATSLLSRLTFTHSFFFRFISSAVILTQPSFTFPEALRIILDLIFTIYLPFPGGTFFLRLIFDWFSLTFHIWSIPLDLFIFLLISSPICGGTFLSPWSLFSHNSQCVDFSTQFTFDRLVLIFHFWSLSFHISLWPMLFSVFAADILIFTFTLIPRHSASNFSLTARGVSP